MKRALSMTLAIVVVASAVGAAQDSKGQPFQALAAAIAQLADRLAHLEANAAHGVPRIVDASGHTIGRYGLPILRQANGVWVSLGAPTQDGFLSSGPPALQFDQPGCTGNAYLPVSPGGATPLVRPLAVRDGIGYYAADPIMGVVIRSRHFSDGSCSATPPPVTVWVGRLATVALSTLDLGIPPYRIE